MRTLNPQTESLQKFIDRAPLSRRQRLIFLLTFLFVVVDGMDLSIVSHIFPKLISEWGASIEQVTLTVVAGIFAMAIGALVSGPAAGRWGRKPVLVFSFVLINVATAALALTGTIEVFIAVRVLACLGIGAVMPLALTMVADWAPAARRAQMVALVFSGVGVGSIIGAYLAAALIPSFGWQTLVVVAGLVPLIVVPFYLRFVPEPPAALIKRGRPSADVRQSLAAIDADSANVDTTADETSQAARVNVFAVVFARVLAVSTTLIWVLTFMQFVIAILVLQYLPILLQQPGDGPGLTTVQSGMIVAMWGWGSLLGQVLVAFALKRFDRFLIGVILAAWMIVGFWSVIIGDFGFLGLTIALFLTGIAFGALPSVVNASATIAYPSEIRATGVGTASFIGRMGGLAGGLTGGLLIGAGFTLQSIFAVLTVPSLIVIVAFLGFRAESRRRERFTQVD